MIVFALSSSSPTVTVPAPASVASPSISSIPFFLNRPADAAGQRRDDLLAARHDGGEVDLGLADLDPELAGLADLGEHVGDAQHRLRGDAGVVQAAAADLVLLDTAVFIPSWAARIAAT